MLKEHACESMYSDLTMAFVPAVMDFLFGKEQTVEEDLRLEGLRPIVRVSKNWQFRSFLNLFESLLLDGETKESLREKEEEARQREEQLKKRASLTSLKAMGTLQSLKGDDDAGSEQSPRSDEAEGAPPKKRAGRAAPYYDVMEPKRLNWVVQQFVMAIVWGFGAPLTVPARAKFSAFVSDTIKKVFSPAGSSFAFKKRIDQSQFPTHSANLFALFYHSKDRCWYRWDYQLDKYDIRGDRATGENEADVSKHSDSDYDLGPAEGSPRSGSAMGDADEFKDRVEFHNIMIATEDSVQTHFLLETLVSHSFNTLLVGDTGTGKTAAIKKFNSSLITAGGWEGGEMVLSATATPVQIQSYMESKLEKHKKGVYGPMNPTNRLLFFVDDLNMPERERYGAQPALEMVRQIIGQQGFYSGKTLELVSIIKCFFVCAMGTPGGGKTLPSMRLLRYFNLLHVPVQSKENLTRIFTKILEWGFADHSPAWAKQGSTMAQLTIDTYQKASQALLPLPRRSHYLFNLRQVSEVVQGLFSVPVDVVEKVFDKLGALKRLWLHEVMRVFSDRLISEDDKSMFVAECLNLGDNRFFKKEELEDPAAIIFANFVEARDGYAPAYQEVKDMGRTRDALHKIIASFNESSRTGPGKLDILLFDYMIQHLARVSRILSKPFGNGLLVGLGGNGRKSIAKLASYINSCSTFEIVLHKNYG